MKWPCPPLTPPVRIRASFEQHPDHRRISRERDNGWRVESEDRLVDALTQFRMSAEQCPDFGRVASFKGLTDCAFDGVCRLHSAIIDSYETVFEGIAPSLL
jgi:hypothetical protein